jgi:A/G-specific adenine glycosylase
MKALLAINEVQAEYREPEFSQTIVQWQKQHGRHSLPWQQSRDAYRVWLSEIMLQQTQVTAVIPYYQRFLQSFPDLESLARAPSEQVMAHWSGLGYYTRARNLHRCAQQVVREYDGRFPSDPALLQELPGIGRSTAAAIAAFSYGTRAAIMDGNVKRVFARVFGIDTYPGEKKTEQQMWARAQALLPERDIESYTQGLMDLGATVCTRGKPDCPRCPLQPRCNAWATGRTASLPVTKPKKLIPVKRSIMLVLQYDAQVLLETRPATGIWGGLLSVPELDGMRLPDQAQPEFTADELQQAAQAFAMQFGSILGMQKLPAFTHVFTHFRLQICPLRIRLQTRLPRIEEGAYQWLDLAEVADAALPAPVKKMLLNLD